MKIFFDVRRRTERTENNETMISPNFSPSLCLSPFPLRRIRRTGGRKGVNQWFSPISLSLFFLLSSFSLSVSSPTYITNRTAEKNENMNFPNLSLSWGIKGAVLWYDRHFPFWILSWGHDKFLLLFLLSFNWIHFSFLIHRSTFSYLCLVHPFLIYVKLESWIQLKDFTSIEMFVSIEKVPFNWTNWVQLKSLQFNFSSEFICDCLSAKGKKNTLLLMFFRKLDQRVFECREFESDVNFD